MNRSVVLLGSGPSVLGVNVDQFKDMDLAAISSGLKCAWREPDWFISVDREEHFRGTNWTCPTLTSVAAAEYWTNPVTFGFTDHAVPSFRRERPPAAGFNGAVNSMTFAVQVLAQMGYRRMVFLGCDCSDEVHRHLADTLELWQPLAIRHGILWQVVGDGALSRFMEPFE